MEDINLKSLRGSWGANNGPKLPQEKKQARKINFVNLAPTQQSNVKGGWKANR